MREARGAGQLLTLVDQGRISWLEGPSGQRLLDSVEDVGSILEQCFSHGVTAVLLYALNLTDRFFDLSSGEAGAILQKLFQYGIRLATVCPPDDVRRGGRFAEMMVEEAHIGRVGVFESAEAAREWIERDGSPSP